MTIVFPAADKMARSAKFAQATQLLCRVLQIVTDTSIDDDFREEQRPQLEKTISATLRMVNGLLTGPAGAHAMICFSSQFVLDGDVLDAEPSTPLEFSCREHARYVLEEGAKKCAMPSYYSLRDVACQPRKWLHLFCNAALAV